MDAGLWHLLFVDDVLGSVGMAVLFSRVADYSPLSALGRLGNYLVWLIWCELQLWDFFCWIAVVVILCDMSISSYL